MKTTQQHTPGPWHIGTNPGPIVYGPLGEQVANMLPCMLDRHEHNANVNLIAAAPELFALVRAWLLTDPSGPHSQACEAAIAKAKGCQP